MFSDSTSIRSPDSQFDSHPRISCFSPTATEANITFSAARDLRQEPQHQRQTSAPDHFTTNPTCFPPPPRRSRIVNPSICTQTHPYRLPTSKSPAANSRTSFFSSPRRQSFKRPTTPLPRITGKFDNSISSKDLPYDSGNSLALPSIFPTGTFQYNSTPVRYTLDLSSQSETPVTASTQSPLEEKQFFPLSQASSYYSLEDLPGITETNTSPLASVSTPLLTFSDADTTRITSNYSLLSRSGLSVSSGSRTSSEESLLYHTPDKGEDKKKFESLSAEKLAKIVLISNDTIPNPESEFPPIVPADVLRHPKFIGKYEIIGQIGSGTYGHVQKAWDAATRNFVAIKTFVNREPYNGIPQHTYREIRTFQFKSHPGLLESVEVIQTENGPCGFPMLHLVTEFIDQDLKIFIEERPQLLVEDKIYSIMTQVISAVSHLNWVLRIMHRDLKPANILISDEGVIKIADFGMAKHYKYMKLLTPHVVTLWYRAPEILLNLEYDFGIDVWSIGCIFAELYNKTPFFEGNNEISQLSLIISRIGLPPPYKWPNNCPVSYEQFENNTCLPLNELLPTATPSAIKAIETMLEFDSDSRVRSDQLDQLDYFKR